MIKITYRSCWLCHAINGESHEAAEIGDFDIHLGAQDIKAYIVITHLEKMKVMKKKYVKNESSCSSRSLIYYYFCSRNEVLLHINIF